MSFERYRGVRGVRADKPSGGVWLGLRKQGKAGLRLVILLREDVLHQVGLTQGASVSLYVGRGPDVHLLGIGAPVEGEVNLVLRRRAPRSDDCELHAPAVSFTTTRVTHPLDRLPDKAWRMDQESGFLMIRRPSWLPALPGYELSGAA